MIIRAWSTFEVKSIDDESRTFEGVASTPSTDRMDDIVDPVGAEFKLPIPLKWQHGRGAIKDPVGWVKVVKTSASGIAVKCEMAKLDFPESLKNQLDECWAKVKAKLMRGFSIGFRGIEADPIKGTFGLKYTKWEWLELSVVDIPANAECTILTVKSADVAALAASGRKRGSPVRLDAKVSTRPGVSGLTKETKMKVKLSDQITQFENKRAANEARMNELMEKSAEEGRTFDPAETEEYDGLESDNKGIDSHLVRLRTMEKANREKAIEIPATPAATPARSAITVKANVLPGTAFTRFVQAKAAARIHGCSALEFVRARKHWMDQTPEVELALKAIVEAGDSTTSGWASQLVPAAQQMQEDFLGVLRPETLLGRIPKLRTVPFNVAVPIGSTGGTHSWVGEAAAAPVTSMVFTNASLTIAKTTGIVAITKELAVLSSPSAEAVVRDEMIKGCRQFLDGQFVGSAAAVSLVSPAGILNGISPTSTSGTDQDAFAVDINTLLGKFITNSQSVDGLVILMSTNSALTVSLMKNALGQRVYPEVTIVRQADGTNGRIAGIPVIASETVGTKIVGVVGTDILMADGNGITIDVSTEASVEMETTPALGEQSPPSTQSVIKSFWQNGLIGIKVERMITWKVARTSAVEYLTSVAYTVNP